MKFFTVSILAICTLIAIDFPTLAQPVKTTKSSVAANTNTTDSGKTSQPNSEKPRVYRLSEMTRWR
jgi:hypothetical protein